MRHFVRNVHAGRNFHFLAEEQSLRARDQLHFNSTSFILISNLLHFLQPMNLYGNAAAELFNFFHIKITVVHPTLDSYENPRGLDLREWSSRKWSLPIE